MASRNLDTCFSNTVLSRGLSRLLLQRRLSSNADQLTTIFVFPMLHFVIYFLVLKVYVAVFGSI